jgi:hypothetical protein
MRGAQAVGMAGPATGDVRQGLAERAARAGVIDASKAPDLHAEDDRATRQITQAAPVMTMDAPGRGPATGAACRCSRQSGAQGYAVVRMVDLIDDVKTIEKSKRVQWDQQAEYRELFRRPQIWEWQAAIACRSKSLCLISAYSIQAGAHKRTKNPSSDSKLTLRVQLQLRIVSNDDTVIRDEVILQLNKSDDRLEAVGLCLKDSKDLLGRLQHAEAQAAAYVNRHRRCSACRLRGKGQYPIVFRTAFGHVPLASPRFYRCRCHPADSRTFSPLAELFTEHTAPELLYLESRWASLISFGMTAALLRDVLPVAGTTNPETVRQHLHRVAGRQDADLDGEMDPIGEAIGMAG